MTDMEQGSPEWFAARCGKVTASRVGDIIARTKTGPSASRANYMAQLIAERLTGTVAESYTNAAMEWGSAMEPDARTAYEWVCGASVALVGFVPHPRIDMAGASPDGYVGDRGLLEIKCPNTATHIETLVGKSVPSKYLPQMQWQMACTGREWVDFASFDPRMPENMQLFVERVKRDDAAIAELEREVEGFLFEVNAAVNTLTRLYGSKEAA